MSNYGQNPMTPYKASDASLPDQLIAGDFPLVTGQSITIASSAALVRGAVLGKITASGKYILSASAAADGSQTPVAVLADDVDASGGDVANVAVYLTGMFNGAKLSLGVGWTLATITPALRPSSIFVRTAEDATDPT